MSTIINTAELPPVARQGVARQNLRGRTITEVFLRHRELILHFKDGSSATVYIPNDAAELEVRTYAAA